MLRIDGYRLCIIDSALQALRLLPQPLRFGSLPVQAAPGVRAPPAQLPLPARAAQGAALVHSLESPYGIPAQDLVTAAELACSSSLERSLALHSLRLGRGIREDPLGRGRQVGYHLDLR